MNFTETAISMGLVDDAQAQESLSVAEKDGIPVGQAMINLGYIGPNDIIDILRTGRQLKELKEKGLIK